MGRVTRSASLGFICFLFRLGVFERIEYYLVSTSVLLKKGRWPLKLPFLWGVQGESVAHLDHHDLAGTFFVGRFPSSCSLTGRYLSLVVSEAKSIIEMDCLLVFVGLSSFQSELVDVRHIFAMPAEKFGSSWNILGRATSQKGWEWSYSYFMHANTL